MAFTGQLGQILSVLGDSLALGFAEDSDPFNQNVNQSLGFSNVAVYDPVLNVLASNKMLSDVAEALYRAVSQSLFTTSVASPDAIVDAANFLGFTDRKIFDVGNFFGFTDVANEATLAIASNLFFTNPDVNNRVIHAHNLTNAFGFVDVISSATFVDAANTITLAEVIISTGVAERDPRNSGFMKQSVSFSIGGPGADSCREKEFAPQIGDSDDDSFETILATPPTLTPTTDGITLTFPRISPTTTLKLEIPDFGNTDVWNFTRIDRTTRGNDRKIFSDRKWAKFEQLTLTLRGNTAACTAGIDEIIAFLNASLMKEIGLVDWEGRTWKGFIVAPETDVSETAAGFELQLVFEGILTTLEVQYGDLNVIFGQDGDGQNIEAIYKI